MKKPESFMITRAKMSAVRANSFVVVEQFIVFFLVMRNSSNRRRIGGAALIRGWRLLTFLSQMRRLFEGGAYSSKYGTLQRPKTLRNHLQKPFRKLQLSSTFRNSCNEFFKHCAVKHLSCNLYRNGLCHQPMKIFL